LPSFLSVPKVLPFNSMEAVADLASVAEVKLRNEQKERSHHLADALLKSGFPGVRRIQDALPVRTEITPGFRQDGVNADYDDKLQRIRISGEMEQAISKVSPKDPNSYAQAASAAGIFYHEMIHHQQQNFVDKPWFKAMEKHYSNLIDKVKIDGKYTPPQDVNGPSLARKYALEAFPKYAGSRAEQWMMTRATLGLMVQHIKDPAELRAALQAQKEAYESLIQKKGQTFGYINEFPSPWDGKFQLPEGSFRQEIDEMTGIPGSFDKAFPEFAGMLRGAR
jgi:hypothetical protein